MNTLAYLLVMFKIRTIFSMAVPSEYSVPRPTLKILRPRGFQVSIPHQEGVQLFAFHGNVNRPMAHLEAGQFSQDILRQTHGRWVFEDRQTLLKTGDTIHFWLYVIKDKLGYRFDNGEFYIKDGYFETVQEPETDDFPYMSSTQPPIKSHYDNASGILRVTTILADRIEELSAEVKKFREYTTILKDLVAKNEKLSRELKFEGFLPPHKDAMYVAQIIMNDKYGLKIPVIKAARDDDGSITFQVSSLDDKLQLIRADRAARGKPTINLIY